MSSSSDKPMRFPFERLAGLQPPSDRLLSERRLVVPCAAEPVVRGVLPLDQLSLLAAEATDLPDRLLSADWRIPLGLLPALSELNESDREPWDDLPKSGGGAAPSAKIVADHMADEATDEGNTTHTVKPAAGMERTATALRDPLLWWSLAAASSALAASLLVLIELNGLDKSNSELAKNLAQFRTQMPTQLPSNGTIQTVSDAQTRMTTLRAEVSSAFQSNLRESDPETWLERLKAALNDLAKGSEKSEQFEPLSGEINAILEGLNDATKDKRTPEELAKLKNRTAELYDRYHKYIGETEK